MPRATQQMATIFDALSDPTRLAIVERLMSEGEQAAGSLAAPFDVSKPAISRHLRILEDAGLIEHRVDRQWRRYRIKPESISELDRWLERYRRFWDVSLDRLEKVLLDNPETGRPMPGGSATKDEDDG